MVHFDRDWREAYRAEANSYTSRPFTQWCIADACWWGRGHPPGTNSICALVSVVTFQTRRCTFQTRPSTFQLRLAGRLTGQGQQNRFPPLRTEVHCGRVLAGGNRPPRRKFHWRLGYRRCISNTTSRISNTSWSIWKAVTDQLRRPGQGERIPALSYGGTLQKRAGGWGGLPRNERLFEAGYGGTLQTHGRAEWCAFFRNVLETHQSRKPDLPHFNHDLVHVASH